MKGFNEDNFKSDIQTTNWDELMNCDHGDNNHSFDSFLDKFNTILNKHTPLKKANKNKSKHNKSHGLQEAYYVQ